VGKFKENLRSWSFEKFREKRGSTQARGDEKKEKKEKEYLFVICLSLHVCTLSLFSKQVCGGPGSSCGGVLQEDPRKEEEALCCMLFDLFLIDLLFIVCFIPAGV
jgi:hypothetical protein